MQVSDQIYRIFHRTAPVVQAVSCDEAFMELPAGCDAM
jgi:nucleotidyltransferase/DNA polymerase involved in DNA repair